MSAKLFGARVARLDRVVPATLEEVLKNSDFVSMHAPDTESARKMLSDSDGVTMTKALAPSGTLFAPIAMNGR